MFLVSGSRGLYETIFLFFSRLNQCRVEPQFSIAQCSSLIYSFAQQQKMLVVGQEIIEFFIQMKIVLIITSTRTGYRR